MNVFDKIKRKSVAVKKAAHETIEPQETIKPVDNPFKKDEEKGSKSFIVKVFKFATILITGTYKTFTGTANVIQKLFYATLIFFMLFMGYKAYTLVSNVSNSISSIVTGKAIKEKARASTEKVRTFLQEKNATDRAKAASEKLKDVVQDKAPGVAEKAESLKAVGLEKARAAKERLKQEMADYKEVTEQRRAQELSRDVAYISVVTLQPRPDGKEEIIPEELVKQVEEDLETLKIEVKN